MFLFLFHLVNSICYPEETLAECLTRKKKMKEQELNGEYEDDFARHSGLGKECIKLNWNRIPFTQFRGSIQQLKLSRSIPKIHNIQNSYVWWYFFFLNFSSSSE